MMSPVRRRRDVRRRQSPDSAENAGHGDNSRSPHGTECQDGGPPDKSSEVLSIQCGGHTGKAAKGHGKKIECRLLGDVCRTMHPNVPHALLWQVPAAAFPKFRNGRRRDKGSRLPVADRPEACYAQRLTTTPRT